MQCPFLREAEVKSCRASSFRKQIPQTGTIPIAGRCESAGHTECPVYCERPAAGEDGVRCPFLAASRVQYCAAAAVTKFVPYSETSLSRCGTGGHRYCELYLAMSEPADGAKPPDDVLFAPNHMWLDAPGDGACHVGLDAFFARVAGVPERISFVTGKGVARAAAVLTVAGMDIPMVFPNAIEITECNLRLRSRRERVASRPYTLGWLFEGIEPAGGGARRGLIGGRAARAWMEREEYRFTRFLREAPRRQSDGLGTMADGGTPAADAIRHLDRDVALRLLHDFFSPHASWI
jgi:glycine cleavage system H lipoate-binding protein